MATIFSGMDGTPIQALTSMSEVWEAARQLLEAAMRDDATGNVFFADLREDFSADLGDAQSTGMREEFDVALDRLTQQSQRPIYHILKQPKNGHAVEMISAILSRNRRAVSYRVLFLQTPQTGFQIGCFIEKIGAILVYAITPACFAIQLDLRGEGARYERGVRVYLSQTLHQFDKVQVEDGEQRVANPFRPVDVMRFYHYASSEWLNRVKATLENVTFIFVKQSEPSMVAMQNPDLTAYVKAEYPQADEAVFSFNETATKREIFAPSAINSAISTFERQQVTLPNTSSAWTKKAEILLRMLRWKVIELRERPEQYTCGLTDEAFHQAFLVGVQANGAVRVLSEMRGQDNTRIGLEFPESAPVALFTNSILQALQNEWLQIPAKKRSDTIEGRREIIGVLSHFIQRLEVVLDSAARRMQQPDHETPNLPLGEGRVMYHPMQGEAWLDTLLGMLRLRSNLGFIGRQPSDLLCGPELFALRARWLAVTFGAKGVASDNMNQFAHEYYERLRDTLHQRQLSGYSIHEIWDKQGVERYVRGLGQRRRETLPHELVLDHILTIIQHMITDPLYEARVVQQDFTLDTWVSERPAILREQDTNVLQGDLGNIERGTLLARDGWRRFNDLWASNPHEDEQAIGRHLTDLALAHHSANETIPFLEGAIPLVGFTARQLHDAASGIAFSAERHEWRMYVSVAPGMIASEEDVSQALTTRDTKNLPQLADKPSARSSHFLEALRRNIPIRILSNQPAMLAWIETPPQGTTKDPIAHVDRVDRARELLKILGGYPNVRWRLTKTDTPIQYEILGNQAVLLECWLSDTTARGETQKGDAHEPPRVGYHSAQPEIITNYARHFDEQWQQALSEEVSLGWLYQQIARHTKF